MHHQYDCIIIGTNLITYTSSIYLQTSGLKILVIKHKDDKYLDFDGYDMISGTNPSSKEELVINLERQCKYVKCDVVECDDVCIEYCVENDGIDSEMDNERVKECVNVNRKNDGIDCEMDNERVNKNSLNKNSVKECVDNEKVKECVNGDEIMNRKNDGIDCERVNKKSVNDKNVEIKINNTKSLNTTKQILTFNSSNKHNLNKIIKSNKYKIKSSYFKITTNLFSYSSKTVLCKDNLFDNVPGFFYCYSGVKYNQAIELCGIGCVKAFDVREYCNKV
ncbi:hypothetical protein NAPIS_ORF02485 [Vairimorpha apis BRL 01]|uniref:Uncharacterized protein n=1 Tax=Vairimorpha apis BRL 01 TaxID=1037528 RepID=T0KX81_9MICR|nr:hypothetical protein NAPIS_ORF02485 [Vairimorpha apis BRL 01]